jgi:tetratricopeptide (TPR) repeat protein
MPSSRKATTQPQLTTTLTP